MKNTLKGIVELENMVKETEKEIMEETEVQHMIDEILHDVTEVLHERNEENEIV